LDIDLRMNEELLYTEIEFKLDESGTGTTVNNGIKLITESTKESIFLGSGVIGRDV